MPVAPVGDSPSPSQPPVSTTHNPWARSLANLLQPWTDALNDLIIAASNNHHYCDDSTDDSADGSLYWFERDCNELVGDSTVPFQGLGAQAFNNVFLLNVDQARVINGKIQDFQNASHDLLTSIQSLNAQYELQPDRGIYWNAGPGQDPWSTAISQFLDNFFNDNNYVLSKLMDGFLTTTAIDDLLKPGVDSTFVTVSSGVQIGVDQITREINSNYQKRTGDSPTGYDTQRHQDALDLLHGFANNMISQLMQWADDLYAYAQTYLGKIVDAGNIQELTTPLPPTGRSQPDPFEGIPATKGASNPPGLPSTRTTYLGQTTANGLEFAPNSARSAIDTVYVRGDNLGQMYQILSDLQSKVSGGSGLLANFLGPVATAFGIVGAFLPLLGEVEAGATLLVSIAGAVLNGASTLNGIAVSQQKMRASDAMAALMDAFTQIESRVNGMSDKVKQRIVIQLSEQDTYKESISPPSGSGNDSNIDNGPDFTEIASAQFTLKCYTIQ